MKISTLLPCALLAFGLPASAQTLAPTQTPVPATLFSTVNPASQLRQAVAKAQAGQTVTACIAGDSTSGAGASPTAVVGTPAGVMPNDGLWWILQQRLIEQNPGVTFSFQNYGIPGTVYSDYIANSQSKAQAYSLTWYSSSANWDLFLGSAGCDIIFHNFGVNDTYTTNTHTFYNILNTESGFSAHPGGIWITGAVANAAAGAPYSGANFQAGYFANSELAGSFAQTAPKGFSTAFSASPIQPQGLIDVGRWFQLAVNGVDFSQQACINATASLPATIVLNAGNSYTYTLPATDGDFDLKGQFIGQLSALTNGPTVNLSVGAMDGGTGGPFMSFIASTGGGTIEFNNGPDISIDKSVTFSGTDLNIETSCKVKYCTSIMNSQLWQANYIKPYHTFTPRMYMTGSGVPATVTFTVTNYSVCSARRYNPILTAIDAYGPQVALAVVNTPGAVQGAVAIPIVGPVPANLSPGISVADSTTPTAITAGTTVTAVNGTTITISAPLPLIGGIAANDNLTFGPSVGNSGGNGINHDASAALNYVYKSAFQSVDLCLICYPSNNIIAPTQAAGTGAGTSPTIAASVVGNDNAFTVTLTTGTSPATSATVDTITWNIPWTPGGVATAPVCVPVPVNANAAGLSGTSSPSWAFSSTTAIMTSGSAALTGATQYIWNVRCAR